MFLIAAALLALIAFNLSAATVRLNDKTFNVLVADTPEKQRQGLSGMDGLEPAQGMIFVNESPSKSCFWMKDMKFNIDILWFDRDNRLTDQQRDLSPSTYPESFCPRVGAKYVLEVPAGIAQLLHLKTGDKIEVNL